MVEHDPSRWRRFKNLLHRAMEIDPDERLNFLHHECGDDDQLRLEIESLLKRHQADGVILTLP